jgi:hypothetical protein
MRGGEGLIAEDLAVGGFAPLIRRGIPGGQAHFAEDGSMGVDVVHIGVGDSAGRHGCDGNAGRVLRTIELRRLAGLGGLVWGRGSCLLRSGFSDVVMVAASGREGREEQ